VRRRVPPVVTTTGLRLSVRHLSKMSRGHELLRSFAFCSIFTVLRDRALFLVMSSPLDQAKYVYLFLLLLLSFLFSAACRHHTAPPGRPHELESAGGCTQDGRSLTRRGKLPQGLEEGRGASVRQGQG